MPKVKKIREKILESRLFKNGETIGRYPTTMDLLSHSCLLDVDLYWEKLLICRRLMIENEKICQNSMSNDHWLSITWLCKKR